jgi:hypothetical protein
MAVVRAELPVRTPTIDVIVNAAGIFFIVQSDALRDKRFSRRLGILRTRLLGSRGPGCPDRYG